MLREFNFLRKLGKFSLFLCVQTDGSSNILFNILGEGSFGNVYLVRRISDGCLYALKKVSMPL